MVGGRNCRSECAGTGEDGVGDDIKNIIIILCCVLCFILENKVNRALAYMF